MFLRRDAKKPRIHRCWIRGLRCSVYFGGDKSCGRRHLPNAAAISRRGFVGNLPAKAISGFGPGPNPQPELTRAVAVTATRSRLAIGLNSLSAFCSHKGGCRACRQDRHIGVDLDGFSVSSPQRGWLNLLRPDGPLAAMVGTA
jgi:hypothetical protein